MNIEKSLDEHEVAAIAEREGMDIGKTVRRKPGPAPAPEIEVLRVVLGGLADRSRPKGSDHASLRPVPRTGFARVSLSRPLSWQERLRVAV